MALNNILSAPSVRRLCVTLFLVCGLFCLYHTRKAPINDFGNYYYGSRLWLDGRFSLEVYTDLHHFNNAIREYGQENYFENYTPVPPFSALFYSPFCLLGPATAKLTFNLLSLLVFCAALWRFLTWRALNSPGLLLLPFLLFFPLYNNIYQGQSYLLIAGLFLEIFISNGQGRSLLPAFLLALVISLKIFPAFLVIYFLLIKNVRVPAFTLIFTFALLMLSYLFLPLETCYYSAEVLPRLWKNDVVGPYYPGNQSVFTMLLNLFSFDALNNPNPLLDRPSLVCIFESIVNALLLMFLWQSRKLDHFKLFALSFLIANLFTRYTTSYSILLLVPLVILFLEEKNVYWKLLLLVFFALAANIPISAGSPYFVLRYVRLLGLLLVFGLCVYFYCPTCNLKTFMVLLLPIFILRYLSFSIEPVRYFQTQNQQGILYDVRAHGDSLHLFCTMGHYDFHETYALKGRIDTSQLRVQGKHIFYKNRSVLESNDNKKSAFIYNDSILVFMSDLHQGIGFYRLRQVPIKRNP